MKQETAPRIIRRAHSAVTRGNELRLEKKLMYDMCT